MPICSSASSSMRRIICARPSSSFTLIFFSSFQEKLSRSGRSTRSPRSEEHTSELQSRENLVCRLLLEKKKKKKDIQYTHKKEKETHFALHQQEYSSNLQ